MDTISISEENFDRIAAKAKTGSYAETAISLLTPNLNLTEKASDADYLVIENAYTVSIIQLDSDGCPCAILKRG